LKYPKLFTEYTKIFPIPQEEWIKLEDIIQVKNFKKGDHMTKPGDHFTQFAMVLKGLFRLYYIGDEGREYIKAFRGEGEMTAPYAEILQQIPARTFVEAMEDSEVLMVDFDDFKKLSKGHECWKDIRLKMAEDLFIQKEQKEFDLLQLSAGERYQSFLKTHGKLKDRIPQYHIASYLGITPVALSRIVKKMSS